MEARPRTRKNGYASDGELIKIPLNPPPKGSQPIVGYDSISLMTASAPTLPDDPGMLKAMLIAERAESDRLRQIIKELQRHRFGRRAETLPEEQLLLGLEEVEQVEAAGVAAKDAEASPEERQARAAKRRTNRGSLPAHLPRVERVIDVESTVCPAPLQTSRLAGSSRLDPDGYAA